MEEKNKKLKLMRYWLVGSTALIFATVTAFLYLLTFGNVPNAVTAGWQVWGTATGLGVAVYFGYKAYLNHS